MGPPPRITITHLVMGGSEIKHKGTKNESNGHGICGRGFPTKEARGKFMSTFEFFLMYEKKVGLNYGL